MARVLVIEDDTSVSHLLRMVLETQGHEVLVADDGSRGLAAATRRSPDAILLDVMMPHLDGFAVLEALREDDRTAAIPVIMVSAMQNESVEERCYRLGAQSFIRKPFDAGILLGTIEEVVNAPPPLASERVAHEPRDVPLAVTLAWERTAGGG
jgi:DNA-binding response OmpR family regulator